MFQSTWTLNETSSQTQPASQSRFTIGNGVFGLRGVFEDAAAGAQPLLVAGIYNQAEGTETPVLVSLPNPLALDIVVDGAPLQAGELLGDERTLDMRAGLLRRQHLCRAQSGALVRLSFERFASLARPHLLASRVTVQAVDRDISVTVTSRIAADDASPHLRGRWHTLPDAVAFSATTTQSGYDVALVSRMTSATTHHDQQHMQRTLLAGQTVEIDRLVAIVSSRDDEAPLSAALTALDDAPDYDALRQEQVAAWEAWWDGADVQIEGDDDAQRALRFALYHLRIAVHPTDTRLSVGAKTLSGPGYGGHVFWDTELFITPVLTLLAPHLARNTLSYRYHNLPGARDRARELGLPGALFPWESADTGADVTPRYVNIAGVRTRIWMGDQQQHIAADVAYAVHHYWRWSGDDAFMCQQGAPIILETAVFWGERVDYRDGRYELAAQIGPDEYHETVDNPVYTNRMVVWHLQTALDLLDWLWVVDADQAQHLSATLALTAARLQRWRDIVRRMLIPFDDERGVHEQFPGFFALRPVDLSAYQPRRANLLSLYGMAYMAQTQVIKQADVVMLMALLGESLAPPDVLLRNWQTYAPRCDQGSSLSPAVHARVAARLGLIDEAYGYFQDAARIDLDDTHGNTADGIHAAACGGLWLALVMGFCGLHLDDDGQPAIDPKLPTH